MNGGTHIESVASLSNAGDPPPTGLNPSSENTKPIAFFCRAKPQGADISSLCLNHKRIFIGWPLIRKDVPSYDAGAWRKWIVDPTCPKEEWERAIADEKHHQQYNRNRNFIDEVTSGSIVVIPRPKQGAVYVGRLSGGFEIVDSPSWGDEYLKLRRDQNLNGDDSEYIADVVQGWPVKDGYKCVDLPRIPGWLRHSMFGRSTYGKFQNHPIDQKKTAYDELDRILQGTAVRIDWTLELNEIEHRLVDTLTPNAFENLVVSLLQLEHPDEIWHQTGGPGDGGIDGLGSNKEGEVVGLMQAKLSAWSVPQLGDLGHYDRRIERYAAVLILKGPDQRTDDRTKLLDLKWVAEAVRRHWCFLPQALAMRVGEIGRPHLLESNHGDY